MKRSIPYYNDYLSEDFLNYLQKEATPVPGVNGLIQVGESGGLENPESLKFLCDLYLAVENELNTVLNRRIKDRKFIDERTKALATFNQDWKRDFLSPDYRTVFGLEDGEGRIVMGPKKADYYAPGGQAIAPVPDYLQGNHVTLFGPPDNAKLSINAMNAYYRKLKDEPAIVEELLSTQKNIPKWGADDEDSKTPLRSDLISSGENLTRCLDGDLSFTDEVTGKKYELVSEMRSHPIKRFPGLALPSFFLFYQNNPLPLHLYDFAIHLFKNWHNPKAMVFYVPKLENEEEARYIRIMLETAEKMIHELHPSYKVGTIRVMIVLENPRAVFRTHEIMDELYPYFVGASLGWHDYLASTARLFKEDSNYRIPVKADPNIVIKYIKASHDLLASVVGSRGGIKVGGMYGILPISNDLMGPSFQVTIKGYIRDVITQFKRDLTGFWVAHPDFVRLGLALVEAWNIHKQGDSTKLNQLVTSLLDQKYHQEMLDFIHGPDIEGLNKDDPMYARSLIVADIKESSFIANNHPDEVRYNVFQTLQYITDWLSGNGCVALPTQVSGIPARVMDDLATAERSRWEVWHEIRHGRFALEDFLKIAHEEMHFIRKDKSDSKKIVQVKWDERTDKWYPVAFNLMLKLMTDHEPVEFATQLFLPFTIESVRASQDPWKTVQAIDNKKFKIQDYIIRFNYYFEMCGNQSFAKVMAQNTAVDLDLVKNLILNFDKPGIIEAASFHGDIGQNKRTLDKMAASEQEKVLEENKSLNQELMEEGKTYSQKFGMKFLISAKDKSGSEMLTALKERLNNTETQEIENARRALWEITQKRLLTHPLNNLAQEFKRVLEKHKINGAQITIINGQQNIQNISLGSANPGMLFELASLSKTVASAFSLEYFQQKNIPLSTSVDELLAETKSDFRLNDKRVNLAHLMSHNALNMHYVNGVPANRKMPAIREFLSGNAEYNYPEIQVINPPGEVFQYSGGGFLVLEHLIEALENKSIFELTRPFLDQLGMKEFNFEQNSPGAEYATGFNDQGKPVEGSRKMFPAFAAGAMGTSEAMAKFLVSLEAAYHQLNSPTAISHDTAVKMLFGSDKGCMKFMGCRMGLGVFIAEAGLNRFAIHQGANDGFRCLYLYCFTGPDRGKGLVALCNADLNGVLFNAEVAQLVLKELKIEGVDTAQFKESFSAENIPQEEIVNMGYKNLVFNAFLPTRPEAITDKGPKDPLASFNKLAGGKVLEVSNDLFARAENLFSDYLPKFDPELFGAQGKIMDSWETVRHNLQNVDYQIIELKTPAAFNYVLLSTKYHSGNFSPVVKLEGQMKDSVSWEEFLPNTNLMGHAEMRIKLNSPTKIFSKVRVSMYPDGGFTRLGLYQDLPEAEVKTFLPLTEAKNIVYSEKIPQTNKPLFIKYAPDTVEVTKNWSVLKPGQEFNNASFALGAKILKATDEHYSPAVLVISPFSPINMFDGMESARSRMPGHYEEVVVALAKKAALKRIEMDFTYFVNNNPLEVEVEALADGKWIKVVEKTNVKAYAGKQVAFPVKEASPFEQVRVRTFPCGGMNRFKAISVY
ncbi:MAG: serine hydrolase [Bdellovibrionales bacterium]|nr:serine hydrolase [Bdellovibrionales bacterium]